MDYKKAYEEALKRFKHFKETYCTYGEMNFGDVLFDRTGKAQEELDSIFPELAESEDERIRKLILGKMEASRKYSNFWSDEEIAWVKKQKESLHITETCKENPDSFTDALKDVIVAIEKYLDWLTGYPDYAPKGKYSLRDMLHCLSILEKQKEHKPVETSIDELQRREDEFYNFKVFAAKQAREHHISFVNDFEWNNFCAELLSYFNEMKDEQPAARSVEDDHIIGFVYDLLNELEWKDEWAMSKSECLQMLNDYRPQPHWKPTDEQMEVLNEAVETFAGYNDYPAIKSLYEDLQKLKEE